MKTVQAQPTVLSRAQSDADRCSSVHRPLQHPGFGSGHMKTHLRAQILEICGHRLDCLLGAYNHVIVEPNQ
jgi:hypothetical protein